MSDNFDNEQGYVPEEKPFDAFAPEEFGASGDQPAQSPDPVIGSFSQPEPTEPQSTDEPQEAPAPFFEPPGSQPQAEEPSYEFPKAPQEEPPKPYYGNPYQEPPRQYAPPYQDRNAPAYGAPQQNGYVPYGYNHPGHPQKQPKSGKGKKIAIVILVIAVIVGLAAIVGSHIHISFSDNTQKTTADGDTSLMLDENASDSAVVIDYADVAENGALSAVEIAKKCRSSVVGVMVYTNGKLAGEGSGVVMGLDSNKKYTYIITCAHVVSGGNYTYGILTLDEKRYEAELVAYDTRTDIGVLKVEATDIPTATFGDSNALQIGETVYAIGNPGGSEFFGSITNGIISSIDRSISSTYTMTCIQHNAAINPGNSGGALVNAKGQVIGINSSKIAATDYEGMSFAVPMATVKPIVESLIKYGYVRNRPKLGIQYASVSSYQLYSMVVAIKGLPAGSLVIAGINEDSGLANTDAQVGDLIIAVNGKDMTDSSVLLDLIDTGAVGDTLTLKLCRIENRSYQTTTFDVTIKLVEDKGDKTETTTHGNIDGYNYGGAESFEDFFRQYFGW